MCGIVGILGTNEAAPILIDALKRLEYRGYDSAGIATVDAGQLGRRRAMGKLVNLSNLLMHEPITGKSGIGNTRWATHGAPNVITWCLCLLGLEMPSLKVLLNHLVVQ